MKKSQSHLKLLNYLDEFVESNYFQDEVKRLRASLNIPPQGLNMPKELEVNLNKTMAVYNLFKLPEELADKDRNVLRELNLAIRKMGKKMTIYNLDINYFIRTYILYNKKILNIINHLTHTDLAQIDDFHELLDEYPNEFTVENVKNLFEYYPIVIKLHPSITQRDLLDFIKVRWDYIEYSLRQYKDKNSTLGKVKKKKAGIRERNDFIYQNKGLPRKKIMELVTDTFGLDRTVDYGYIGKIISTEKKKRKDV